VGGLRSQGPDTFNKVFYGVLETFNKVFYGVLETFNKTFHKVQTHLIRYFMGY